MASLQSRLVSALSEVLAIEEEPDGALTVRHDGTLASLRVVTIAEGLDLVSLTQIVAWDLPLTKQLRDRVADQARDTLLGSVTLMEKTLAEAPEKTRASAVKRNSGKTADVMLRYNFPATGLADGALRTLVLLVLEKGADVRRALVAG
ncbi:MAG TPA: hypothetical protein VFR17_00210 [Mycobacterium sp.]|nr:hypothetical protein [Mycobacterium sp.]